jgi:hypothetical protein
VAYRQTVVLRWRDAQKWTRTQAFYTQDNPAPDFGTAEAIVAAIQAASHSGLYYKLISPIELVNAEPEGGDYPSVKDYLMMNFRSTAGTTGKLNVPAPVNGLFLPDNETMDPDSDLVIAIRDAMFAAGSDAYGNAWETLISGRRARVATVNPFGM